MCGNFSKIPRLILWQFDVEKEQWIAAIETEQFFDSEFELREYVYDLFSDVVFDDNI